MNQREFNIADAEGMETLGAAMARQVGASLVIFLMGELGAGKTTLVRGFLRGCGYSGRVRSPTYTLIEPYDSALDGPVRTIYHLDLYRLGHSEELEWIGIRDLLDEASLVLVEWPERGAGVLPAADIEVRIAYAEPGRQVTLIARSPAGERLVAQLDTPGC